MAAILDFRVEMTSCQTDARIGILVVDLPKKVSSCMNLGDLVQKLIFQDGVSGHLLFDLVAKIPGIFGRDTGAKFFLKCL